MQSEYDKDLGMSDTLAYRDTLREAFPVSRHGAAKASIYAAFRYISPKVRKQFTERRARSIWEGTAARIDAEEARVIEQAKIEETRREYQELRARLARMETALAVADEAFFGPQMDAYRSASAPMGRVDRTGIEG